MSVGLVSALRAGKLSWHIMLPLSLLIAFLYPPHNLSSNLNTYVDLTPSSPLADTSPPLTDDVLGTELHARVHEFAKLSMPYKVSAAGVNRPFLSQVGAEARQLLLSYMSDAGLNAHVDGAGNVVGRLLCPSVPARRAVALGSHFDSVRGGGMWDGVYGVLSAIAVAKKINRGAGGVCALPFDIIVVAFDDEEGNNPFGTTNFGAKAFAGVLDLASDVRDFSQLAREYARIFPAVATTGDGSLEERVAARVASAAVDHRQLLAFLEVHIEQGPVLEQRGLPVAVVDAIAGQTRLSVTIRGNAGHAGTVPMHGRVDALAAAAEVVSAVERVGRARATDRLVATVGTLQVELASTNVIPGLVRFSVDIRAPVDDVRLRAVGEILRFLKGMERKRGVKVWYEKTHEVGGVSMTKWVREVLQEVEVRDWACWGTGCRGKSGGVENYSTTFERFVEGEVMKVGSGKKVMSLTSGAGHDTQFMSRVTDVGMLFVRCRGGVSHHVDEHVEEEDSYLGARALLEAVERIGERIRVKVV